MDQKVPLPIPSQQQPELPRSLLQTVSSFRKSKLTFALARQLVDECRSNNSSVRILSNCQDMLSGGDSESNGEGQTSVLANTSLKNRIFLATLKNKENSNFSKKKNWTSFGRYSL